MKYAITVDGAHKAEVDITLGGKGGFTGSVISPEYGTGAITKGVQTGNNLTGEVSLKGYTADFSATMVGTNITGTLKYGWFIHMNFNGPLIPEAPVTA